MKKILIFLVMSCLFMQAFTQVPQGIRYQGIARNALGVILSQQKIALRLSIVQDSAKAVIVYSEVQNVQTNDFGLFTVIIGKGIPTGNFGSIDWSKGIYFLRTEMDINNGTNYALMGESQLLSVPYAFAAGNVAGTLGRLEVQASKTALVGDTLFEVKDKLGQTVFGVYEEGVRVYVMSGSKGAKSGFAVGGRTGGKNSAQDYLLVTNDSVRIYIDSTSNVKGARGGFTVGGRSPGKGTGQEYFTISGKKTADTVNPSQARILWYPNKEAFLTGRVLVESPDSVGTNSFSAGFESKAIGNYSQAMGYRSTSRGTYSAAFGDSSIAQGITSFAAGYKAKAIMDGTFALGNNVIAGGVNSFAVGINSTTLGTSAIAIGLNAVSNGFVSVAIGNHANASISGSTAMGDSASSTGLNSIALGYLAKADGDFSSSLGNNAIAIDENATAIGYNSRGEGNYAAAFGSDSKTRGNGALALGYKATAIGNWSTALGNFAHADSIGGLALGNNSSAQYSNSIAIGSLAKSSGLSAVAIGPNSNASGNFATAIGNSGTNATGDYSMAIGFNANTGGQEGTIVFGDHAPSSATVTPSQPNQFIARAAGGVYFYTKSDLQAGISIAPNGNSWNIVSDRRKKENFKDVSRENILGKLQNVNIQSWNYIAQGKQIRHIGITAQDFMESFGYGHSDTVFTEVDLAGISMVAIQGLADRSDSMEKQIQRLTTSNELLKKSIEDRDKVIEQLKNDVDRLKELQVQLDKMKLQVNASDPGK
jgi:trimeric autotransporter adhesin